MAKNVNLLTKDEVWEFFKENRDFFATCTTCGKPYKYVKFDQINNHLKKYHKKEIKDMIEQKRRDSPGIYFSTARCHLCIKKISPNNFAGHLFTEHNLTEIFNYEMTQKKHVYYEKTDTFTVKCKVKNCISSIKLTFHKSNLQGHLSTHITLSKRNVQTFEEVKENYDIEEYFQVKCKFCNFQGSYVDTTNIYEHVRVKHYLIYEGEVGKPETPPWIFFKYTDDEKKSMTCLLCSSTNYYYYFKDIAEDHLDEMHSTDPSKQKYIGRSWIWRYCKPKSESFFEVECGLCPSESPAIRLDEKYSDLHDHIQEHLSSMSTSRKREYDDTAGPSEIQSKMTKK